jgi:hypothetical protein
MVSYINSLLAVILIWSFLYGLFYLGYSFSRSLAIDHFENAKGQMDTREPVNLKKMEKALEEFKGEM